MKAYNERNYGANIDGNNGISFWDYELEKSDQPRIIDILTKEYFDEETNTFDFPSEVNITLYSEETDQNVDFDINPKDYV